MIKLFISDIDGTILHNGTISPHDIDALHTAVKQGVTLCFASGRLDNEITHLLQETNVPFHRISQNGAFIHTHTNEQLHATAFEQDILADLLEAVEGDNFVVYISDANTYYIKKKCDLVREIEERANLTSIELPTLYEEIGNTIHPVKFAIGGETEDLFTLQKKISAQFGDRISAYISAPQCLDIVPANVSKGGSIMMLLETLGLKPEETACIGDSYNDLPMFKVIPNSFAMENADDAVKKHTKYVVPSVKDAIDIILATRV
ncbi:HAD family hydrolase [Priestia taiwanensis]|uniref:Haloacid dehalogenase n=1 Tax=Priestia taiwanensis TaxID=1347902 RepID=A0A917EPQ8_9BACI|nr:HAD family hydrolase [Priestia taiwanensis]MBM7363865.1 Cof subfamily protein (haloacid dehalogenase superfamily) [Priestia taiwanensis]GGE69636.1 haloacid dehalogenase [Priestia taiwanensis]